jgi:hypothetical protein
MERSEIPYDTNLPGYDALTTRDQLPIADEVLEPYLIPHAYARYLENDAYNKYLHMHKVLVRTGGAEQLIGIGQLLEQEKIPRYLDAAGWAYAEAAMTNHTTTVEAVGLVIKAEELWEQALSGYRYLAKGDHAEWFTEDSSEPYRLALNLAYAPVLKSILVGNVTQSVRERAFADTLAIAQLAGIHLELAKKEGSKFVVSDYSGFIHECNALLALLYLNDPRYIPMPSSARADTGYYHREQTHDIVVINQHWGQIKKIIPIEVKAAASLSDRQRYKALILRGKMHLAVTGMLGCHDARNTLDAFASVFEHTKDKLAQQKVDHAATTVQKLLRLYQQGMDVDSVAVNSLTQFRETNVVEAAYPEFSKRPQ